MLMETLKILHRADRTVEMYWNNKPCYILMLQISWIMNQISQEMQGMGTESWDERHQGLRACKRLTDRLYFLVLSSTLILLQISEKLDMYWWSYTMQGGSPAAWLRDSWHCWSWGLGQNWMLWKPQNTFSGVWSTVQTACRNTSRKALCTSAKPYLLLSSYFSPL